MCWWQCQVFRDCGSPKLGCLSEQNLSTVLWSLTGSSGARKSFAPTRLDTTSANSYHCSLGCTRHSSVTWSAVVTMSWLSSRRSSTRSSLPKLTSAEWRGAGRAACAKFGHLRYGPLSPSLVYIIGSSSPFSVFCSRFVFTPNISSAKWQATLCSKTDMAQM